jgi:D-glycero-D-manno-heptose 1,7-bisphosphate phosphatase
LTRAHVLVLALEIARHREWNPFEHWLWSVAGGCGLVEASEVDAFLAQVPERERERLAVWPADRAPAEPALHADTAVLERWCERALARRTAGPGRAGFFVDRDGTLIDERHHLADPDGVALLPGVAEALRTVRSAGHPVVVISNQAGVGRGLFTEAHVHRVMARLRQLLRVAGVELDAIRFCPHAPDGGCDCRKPGTRLLHQAAEDLRLSLPDSAMVGDKWIDVEAGQAARAAGVLVRTGHGALELSAPRTVDAAPADRVCDDLAEAARWFLARQD